MVTKEDVLSQLTIKTIPLSEISQKFFERDLCQEDLALLQHVHSVFWIYAPEQRIGVWSNIAANRLYGSDVYFRDYDWGPYITEKMQETSSTAIGLEFTLQQLAICSRQRKFSISITGPAEILLPGLPGSAHDIEIIIKPLLLRHDRHGSVNCCLVQAIESLSKATSRSLRVMGPGTAASSLFDQTGRLLSGTNKTALKLEDVIGEEVSRFMMESVLIHSRRSQHCQQQDSRWILYDALPARDPVTLQPAVLLQTSDVTALKIDQLAAESETERLKVKNDELSLVAQRLLSDKLQTIDADSLADKILEFLNRYIDASGLEKEEARHLQRLLIENANMYDPIGLEDEVRRTHTDLAEDVIESLLQLGQPSFMRAKTFPELRFDQNDTISHETLPARADDVIDILRWDFDVLSMSDGQPLRTIAAMLFERHGLISAFDMDLSKLNMFLVSVEKGYPQHPYHNAVHAANVLYMTNILLEKTGLAHDKLVTLSCLFAAIIHDLDHKGVTNEYLIRTRSSLAIRYNDSSPHENHHLAAGFCMLLKKQANFLHNMSEVQFLQFRATVIDLVLATDMSFHFSIINKFKAYHFGSARLASHASESNTSSISDKALINMIIKCADIGHVAAEWSSHVKWVNRLQEEMWRQGDQERKLGLSVSTFMDRQSQRGVSHSQVGFLEIFVKPAFTALSEAYPSVNQLLLNSVKNEEAWMLTYGTS